jgi:hypothetical protein
MPKHALPAAPSYSDDFIALAMHLRDVSDDKGAAFLEAAEKEGVKPRRAYYLREVARLLGRIDTPHDRLRKIGWTKLSIIARHLTTEDTESLLSKAENGTVADVKDFISGRKPPARRHVMFFYLDDDQHAAVRRVLLEHGASPSPRGLHGKEAALVKALTADADGNPS